MADGTVSARLAEWLLVALIVFSLIFGYVLHKIEHWINHKHQQLKAVTWVLYRELMLLGVVSFIFIMYETIAKPVGDTVLSFEFAHVFIFLLAIFYTLVLACTMATSLRMSKRWKHMEQIDLVRYLNLKEKYTSFRVRIQSRKHSFWSFIPWWFPNFKTLLEYWDLHELMAFHDIRFQVIYYRNLPEHFRFATFLRRIKASTFLQLVDTHWSLWVILLALLLLDITRRYLTENDDDIVSASAKFILRAAGGKKTDAAKVHTYGNDTLSPAFIIGGAVILFTLCQVLSIKIRRVYWELTKHPRVYYRDIEPQVFGEEEAAAVQQEHSVSTHQAESANRAQNEEDMADDEGTDSEEIHPNPQPDSHSARRARGFGKTHFRPSVDLGSSADRAAQPPSRTSIQIRRPVQSDLTASAISDADSTSMDQPSLTKKRARGRNGHRGDDRDLPQEYHETTGHYSLDLGRAPGVINRPLAVAPGMHHTSVAHAAVSAASRRSLEAARRTSLEIPDPSRSSPELDRDDGNSRRFLRNPRILSYLSSRGSTDGENSRASVDRSNPLDSRNRRSLERTRVTSRDEPAEIYYGSEMDSDAERSGLRRGDSLGGGRGEWNNAHSSAGDRTKKSSEALEEDVTAHDSRQQHSFLRKQKTLDKLNATILKNRELQEAAHHATPSSYPRFVTKLIPRLGRVASPVEKLFWFGSHKFYLYCVEFTLFFSTVLVASAFASLALVLLHEREFSAANIVSFVLPPLTLSFVLLRIAGIVKKYIFIIHNASLVPEAVAINAIHTATKKGPVVASFDDNEASGDETELEDKRSARERRRTLGRYIRSEAEAGNVMGVDAEEAIRFSEAGVAAERRARKRSRLLKLRSQRTDKFAQNAMMLPV